MFAVGFFSAAAGENTLRHLQTLGDECGVGLEGYFEGCEKGCLGLLGLCVAVFCPGKSDEEKSPRKASEKWRCLRGGPPRTKKNGLEPLRPLSNVEEEEELVPDERP